MTSSEHFYDWLRSVVPHFRFSFQNERGLQDQVEELLKLGRWNYSREHRLSPQDRPDFLIPFDGADSVALEVKLGAPNSADLRQVRRYSEFAEVGRLIFLCTQRGEIPDGIGPRQTPLHQVPIGFHRL